MNYEINKKRFDDVLSKVEKAVNGFNLDKRICYIRLDYDETHDKIDCNVFWNRMDALRMYSEQMGKPNTQIYELVKGMIGTIKVALYVHYDDCDRR